MSLDLGPRRHHRYGPLRSSDLLGGRPVPTRSRERRISASLAAIRCNRPERSVLMLWDTGKTPEVPLCMAELSVRGGK
jgi:hypothetical protein